MTDAFVVALQALAPTTLEAIDAGASLQTRVDRKYVVTSAVVVDLIDRFEGAVLDIDGVREFEYQTTYYDTPGLDLYLDTARRRPKRFKARVRTYLDSGLTMIEIKTRNGRGKTVKHRLGYEGETEDLDDAVRGMVDTHVDTDLTERLAPSLVTSFTRTTLLGAGGASRCTIDRSLQAVAPDGAVVSPPIVIIESKTSGGIGAVDRRLWHRGIRPTPISKYCTSLAAIHPDLPANHWHQTLQRHFAVPAAVWP